MRATTKFIALWAVACGVLLADPAETSPWLQQPSDVDLATAYPAGGESDGWARLECRIDGTGALGACGVLDESHPGQGFGAAALSLVRKFRAAPGLAASNAGGVRLRLDFLKPEGPPFRDAVFKTGSHRGLGPPGPYFPDRAFRMRQGGVVLTDCRVTDRGLLRDCRIAAVAPAGWGFDEATLRMALTNWMTAAPLRDGQAGPADQVWRFRVDFPRPPYDARMHGRLPRDPGATP